MTDAKSAVDFDLMERFAAEDGRVGTTGRWTSGLVPTRGRGFGSGEAWLEKESVISNLVVRYSRRNSYSICGFQQLIMAVNLRNQQGILTAPINAIYSPSHTRLVHI